MFFRHTVCAKEDGKLATSFAFRNMQRKLVSSAVCDFFFPTEY